MPKASQPHNTRGRRPHVPPVTPDAIGPARIAETVSPDAALQALAQQYQEADAHSIALDDARDQADTSGDKALAEKLYRQGVAKSAELSTLADTVATLPARSLAGLRAKASIVRTLYGTEPPDSQSIVDGVMWSLVTDTDAMNSGEPTSGGDVSAVMPTAGNVTTLADANITGLLDLESYLVRLPGLAALLHSLTDCGGHINPDSLLVVAEAVSAVSDGMRTQFDALFAANCDARNMREREANEGAIGTGASR